MGTDSTTYLMIGIDVGIENLDYDLHQKEIEGAPDRRCDIVYDRMSNKFCVAGKILASADNFREGFSVPIEVPELDDVIRFGIVDSIHETFGIRFNSYDVKILLFTEFS